MTASTTEAGLTARNVALRAALPEHLDRRTWSRERIARHQRDAARSLLGCALARSRFHGPRIVAAGIDPERFELADLPRLPVMTKRATMAAFDDVVTDPRITRARVEAHLAATGPESTELLGRYMVLASGGSSGQRGIFVYDRPAAVDYRMGLVRTALAQALAAGPLPPGAADDDDRCGVGRARHPRRVVAVRRRPGHDHVHPGHPADPRDRRPAQRRATSGAAGLLVGAGDPRRRAPCRPAAYLAAGRPGHQRAVPGRPARAGVRGVRRRRRRGVRHQ